MKTGGLSPIESIYGSLNDEQKSAIADYCREVETYTPYIKSVENHWFKNLDFEGCYEEQYYPEGEGVFTYEYVGLGEEDDVLADIDGLYVCETREKDYFQTREPKIEDNSNIIKAMLTRNSYYIYNGVALSKKEQKRPYKAIIEKINGTNVMDTSAFQYAFAILESVHTQDAEYILRDLKELFRDMEIDVDAEIEKNENIEPLEWIIPDYIPVVWDPMFNTQETSMTIRARSESNTGFKGEEKVVMPANGTVESITTDEDDGTQTIKITFTGTDRKELLGLSIYIRGLKIDSNISVKDTISAGTQIGTTVAKKNITIIMTNKTHSAITNVDSYICPPEKNKETNS